MLVDTDATLDDGTKLRLFAPESLAYPGGVNYRFQYYDPDTEDSFLRFDNSQVPPTAPVTTTATSGLTARNR